MMLRSTASKVMWVGRVTVFLVGLSVVLALVFGVATTAFGANGNPFLLGKKNVASAVSTLIKRGAGPALKLKVRAGQPPMTVNSTTRVNNLNADNLDGLDSGQLVHNTGTTTFSAFGPWSSQSNSVTVSKGTLRTTFTKDSGVQGQTIIELVPPSVPSTLYGKEMKLTGVEICYDSTDQDVVLDRVSLAALASTKTTSASGNVVVEDNSAPDGDQCQKFTGTPQLMGTNSFPELYLALNWSGAQRNTLFYIQRTTFFMEPSDTPAAAQ